MRKFILALTVLVAIVAGQSRACHLVTSASVFSPFQIVTPFVPTVAFQSFAVQSFVPTVAVQSYGVQSFGVQSYGTQSYGIQSVAPVVQQSVQQVQSAPIVQQSVAVQSAPVAVASVSSFAVAPVISTFAVTPLFVRQRVFAVDHHFSTFAVNSFAVQSAFRVRSQSVFQKTVVRNRLLGGQVIRSKTVIR